MMRSLPLAFVALAACGPAASSPSAPADGGAPPAGDVVAFDLRAPVAPGAEAYVCELVRMPAAPGEIFVRGGSFATTEGTHHFLLFRTSGVDPRLPLGAPIDCFEGQGVMRYERGFVTGGQTRADSADFPAGAALAFSPGEVLLFQAHLLNAGAAPLDARVHVELRTTPARAVRWRVGTFRFYDPFIYVPAHGAATARARCPIARDVTIVSAGSHMHRRGVGYRALLDLPGAPPSTAPFFATTDWEHPPYFEGPLAVPAGAHLRFACDYASDDAVDVVQGLSADANEMCMFSAFYYPEGSADEDACAQMDQVGSGDRSCAQTLSCVQLCPRSDAPNFGDGKADVGPCYQRCITESCPNASAPLFAELECAQAKCADACASYGAACSACVLAQCRDAVNACEALACNP